jgi:hypothetical protein
LYPAPADSKRKKTRTPPAGIDLGTTFARSSIEPNARWFFTAHHELGHGYFKAYTHVDSLFVALGAAPGSRRRRRINRARVQSGAISVIAALPEFDVTRPHFC